MTGRNRAHGVTPEVSTGGSLISDTKLRQLYTNMLHCRLLAEYAAGLRFRARSVNPYACSTGQEAIASGWVTDLQPADSIALASGDAAPSLVKGVPLAELMASLRASRKAVPHPEGGGHDVLPASSNIAEQFAAITATAFANKRKAKSPVVVSFVSAATMALGPWHDLRTRAARQKLPIIFVVENNPWDSAARISSDSTEDFTHKVRGYGLTGISVDGNDVVAVYRVAHESLDRVRHGDGPVIVEARTYSESGRKKPARSERDPLLHMERYLKAKKLYEKDWKQQLVEDFKKELKRAAKLSKQAQEPG